MQLEKYHFTVLLLKANGIESDEFASWIFHPGMLFNPPLKWWGDGGRRDFPHEGVDFCLYGDTGGGVKRLGPETRIPVMQSGVVRGVFSDYLGRTLLVKHEGRTADSNALISFYAHIRPLDGIQPGVRLNPGDPLATIVDTDGSKAKILPHLHYKLGVASTDLVYEGFVWNDMRNLRWVKAARPHRTAGSTPSNQGSRSGGYVREKWGQVALRDESRSRRLHHSREGTKVGLPLDPISSGYFGQVSTTSIFPA